MDLAVFVGQHPGDVLKGPTHIGTIVESGLQGDVFYGQVGFKQQVPSDQKMRMNDFIMD